MIVECPRCSQRMSVPRYQTTDFVRCSACQSYFPPGGSGPANSAGTPGLVLGVVLAAALGFVVLVVGVGAAAIWLAGQPAPVAQNPPPAFVREPVPVDEQLTPFDGKIPAEVQPDLTNPDIGTDPPLPMVDVDPEIAPPLPDPDFEELRPQLPKRVPSTGVPPKHPPVELKGPPLPPFTPAENPYKPGTQTRLKLANTIPAPDGFVARKLVFSNKCGALFALNEQGTTIWGFDTWGKKPLREHRPKNQFTDLSLSPDQSTLFAADMGDVTTTLDGIPIERSYVHRYNCTSRRWDSRQAPKFARKIEALNYELVLVLEDDRSPDLTLNRWTGGGVSLKELARVRAGANGTIAYDPRTGLVYHATDRPDRTDLTIITATPIALKAQSTAECKPEVHRQPGGLLLSPTGERLYHHTVQRKAADPKTVTNRFDQGIVAASRDLAFSTAGVYYDAGTAKKLGTVCPNVGAICVSPDGLSAWVYVTKPQEFRQYLLEGEK